MNLLEQHRKHGRWSNLERCREYSVLYSNFSHTEMNRFEEQLKEYLNKTDMTEGDLNSVPLIVCWYEGLVSTELLLMELLEIYILDAKR